MGGKEKDVIERQRLLYDSHCIDLKPQKRIIPLQFDRGECDRAAPTCSPALPTSIESMRMSIIRIARAAALGSILASLSMTSGAQVYKWTDEDGRVIVSDSPPPGKIKAQQIRKGATTPELTDSKPKSDQPAAADKGDASEKGEKSDKQNGKKTEKKTAEPETKKILIPAPPDRATCDHARRNLQALESGSQLNTQGPGGERVLMDEAARSRELARVRDTLRNCQN